MIDARWGKNRVMVVPIFFNDTATAEIYALSLHDALPIFDEVPVEGEIESTGRCTAIWDKGKGAVVEMESESVNLATGKLLLKTRMSVRSEEHTSEPQSHLNLVCRLLVE